jgi:hypothetical protein
MAGVTIAFLEFAPSVKNALDFTSRLKGTPLDPASPAFVGPHDWSSVVALVMFGVLIALLALVGTGKFLRPKPAANGDAGRPPSKGQ